MFNGQDFGEAVLLDISQCKAVSIQSHGMHHLSAPNRSTPDLINDFLYSRCYLEDILSKPVTSLAVPFGKFDSRVPLIAQTLGYKQVFFGRSKPNFPQTNPFNLSRYAILDSTSFTSWLNLLNGRYDFPY